MFFIKKTSTLLLIVAFTQAFSQEFNSEKFHSDDKESVISRNTDNVNQYNDKRDGFMETPSIQEGSSPSETTLEKGYSVTEEAAVPIEFLGPSAFAKFKRGKVVEVRWTGGSPEDEYALDLFDGRFHYRHIGELKNSGIYPWIIPADVAPGKEYKFKLTNTEDFGEYAFSQTFIIKRKVPIVAWVVPGAIVVGGGLFLLIFIKPDPEIPDLPRPIEPN